MKTSKLLILCIAVTSFGCRSTKKTTHNVTETTVAARPVAVPYDTLVPVKGSTLDWHTTIHVDSNSQPYIEPQTVTKGRVTTTAFIKNGQLHVSTHVADTVVQVSGTASGWALDTTVRQTTVITTAKEPTLWQKLSSGITNTVVTITVCAVLILILIIGYRYVKSQY